MLGIEEAADNDRRAGAIGWRRSGLVRFVYNPGGELRQKGIFLFFSAVTI
jgi:hypothetical protein